MQLSTYNFVHFCPLIKEKKGSRLCFLIYLCRARVKAMSVRVQIEMTVSWPLLNVACSMYLEKENFCLCEMFLGLGDKVDGDMNVSWWTSACLDWRQHRPWSRSGRGLFSIICYENNHQWVGQLGSSFRSARARLSHWAHRRSAFMENIGKAFVLSFTHSNVMVY